jgi:hypothetical protein
MCAGVDRKVKIPSLAGRSRTVYLKRRIIMVAELLKKIGEVTNEHSTITCTFETNTYNFPGRSKGIKVQWDLYIANTISKDFETFEKLTSYIDLLCIELKKIDPDALKKAVEIADELIQKEVVTK